MSQLESVIPLLESLVLDWTANRRDSLRARNRSPYAAPHSAYPCRGDDSWRLIAFFSNEEGIALCHCLGEAQRVTDPRFDTLLGRKQNEDELDRLVAEWTSGRSAEDVMTNFKSDGVSSGSVLNWEGLGNDPSWGTEATT